jgi:hypothetical protein
MGQRGDDEAALMNKRPDRGKLAKRIDERGLSK